MGCCSGLNEAIVVILVLDNCLLLNKLPWSLSSYNIFHTQS